MDGGQWDMDRGGEARWEAERVPDLNLNSNIAAFRVELQNLVPSVFAVVCARSAGSSMLKFLFFFIPQKKP